MPDTTRQAYSVADVCERFGVNASKVIEWIKAGELRAVNVARDPSGKRPRWRILAEALTEFETARTSQPKPIPARKPMRRSADRVIQFFK